MKYYENIEDIFIYNWDKCCNGDLTFCRLDKNNGSEKDDNKYWDVIFQSYLTEFGFSFEDERMINLKTEIAILQCDFIITGDRFLLNRLAVLEDDLKEMIKELGGSDLDTNLIYMSKWVGFKVDSKKTTVREYFKYSAAMKTEMEHKKKIAKQNG